MNMAATPDPLRAIRSRIDASTPRCIDCSSTVERHRRTDRDQGLSTPGTAFRPDREADMMRRMVMRHRGALPLTTVEHIWREVITTFTAMQAPFAIAAARPRSARHARRDPLLFRLLDPRHLLRIERSSHRAVAGAPGNIAVIEAEARRPMVEGLDCPRAPKIFAKLPFIHAPGRPADFAAYVIGPRMEQVATPDIQVFRSRGRARLGDGGRRYGGVVAGRHGTEWLFELPVAATVDQLAAASGQTLGPVSRIGDFFQPIRVLTESAA
jgi:hypothetical protein